MAVAALDHATCPLCGAMDGKVFKLSEYQPGLTANPFRPWCRCCTAPYDEDVAELLERLNSGANPLPGDMSYKQWKAWQDESHGAGYVDQQRKLSYNEVTDKAQWKAYRERLGADVPRKFSDFQTLKYKDAAQYDELVGYYRYKGKNPDSGKGFFKAEQTRQALVSTGAVRAKGTVVAPPSGFIIGDGNVHATGRLAGRGLTLEDAQSFVDNAVFALKQQKGTIYTFYSENGFAAVDTDGVLRTAGHLDEKGQKLFDETVKQIEKHK